MSELYYEPFTGKYFKSSKEKLDEVKRRVNERIDKEANKIISSVTLPTGLTDEEVLKMYHESSEKAIKRAEFNLGIKIMREELGLNYDDWYDNWYTDFVDPEAG